jgi:hypothetical protein
MSLNMLIETSRGFDYTGADCREWMHDVGFTETYVQHLAGPDSWSSASNSSHQRRAIANRRSRSEGPWALRGRAGARTRSRAHASAAVARSGETGRKRSHRSDGLASVSWRRATLDPGLLRGVGTAYKG